MNPQTSALLQCYPERLSDGAMSEIWHGDRLLKNLPRHLLCPHYISGSNQFYVDELSLLHDGRFVIPIRWILVDGTLISECWVLIPGAVPGLYTLHCSASGDFIAVDIPATEFALDFMKLKYRENCPVLSGESLDGCGKNK
jgi:hypothetical protein